MFRSGLDKILKWHMQDFALMANLSKSSCRNHVELISWFELPNRADSIVGLNLQKVFLYLCDSSLNYFEKDMKEGSISKQDKTKMAELKRNKYLIVKVMPHCDFPLFPGLKISGTDQ